MILKSVPITPSEIKYSSKPKARPAFQKQPNTQKGIDIPTLQKQPNKPK